MYTPFEGRGLATEGMAALIDRWILTDPAVCTVRATIPPWHTSSIRVAEKLGMTRVGTAEDPEVGAVLVFERRRGEREGSDEYK